MAGSQTGGIARSPFDDPIIAARIEAIRQLAGGVSDRIAVMDREFNVVYANASAWTDRVPDEVPAHSAKCYEAFAHRSDPCGTCPATKVFESPGVQSISCAAGGDGARKLAKAKLSARLLLQVHDELLFEAPPKDVDRTIEVVEAVMENAAKPAVELSVPLVVEVGKGHSWAEAH